MTQSGSTAQRKLPDGWQELPLSAIATIDVGATQVTERSLALADEDMTHREDDVFIPLILSGDIKNEKEIKVTRYSSRKRIEGMGLVNQILTQDRVLLAKSRLATAGRVATFQGTAIHNGATVSIIPKELAHVQVDFLFYYLQGIESHITDEIVTMGKTSITKAHLKGVSIRIPPPKTQQWIVQQLDKAVAEIRGIREQLEATRGSIEQLTLVDEVNTLTQSHNFLDRKKREQQTQLSTTLQATIDKLFQTESVVIRRMTQGVM